MTELSRDRAIRGKTIQFRWTEGPTKGTTREHVFHEDGTVEWRDAELSAPARGGAEGRRPAEKPPYAAIKVAEEAYVVSYLAASGYTWYPVRGTFKVVK